MPLLITWDLTIEVTEVMIKIILVAKSVLVSLLCFFLVLSWSRKVKTRLDSSNLKAKQNLQKKSCVSIQNGKKSCK